MSLFDSASLVVTPNGYKEDKLYSIKPTDGSGDLVVTRATTATRVNSAGLIEECPYNLVRYSEDISNSAWAKYNITISANSTTAPNGTLTAEKLLSSNSTSFQGIEIQVNYISGQKYTNSIYFKYIDTPFVQIITPSFVSSNYVNFNIQTGEVVGGVYEDATVTSVGNGWYRCSFTFISNYTGSGGTIGAANLINSASSSRASDFTGNGVKGIYLWGAQLVSGTSAKEYFSTTDRLNVPRLDYTNSSCPSILVEPQRTNLVFPSNIILSGNGTLTQNAAISPDGTNNSNSFIPSGAGFIYTNPIATTLQTYTFSIYLKGSVNGQKVRIQADLNGDLIDFTLTNQWQKYSVTFNSLLGAQSFYILSGTYFSPAQNNLYYFYGAQLEAGSYATSYIPTVASSVTRNADVISKTGISSLIGQTEGTFFVEFNYNSINDGTTSRKIISLNDGSSTNLIDAYIQQGATSLQARLRNGGVGIGAITSGALSSGNYKLAYAYKNSDFVLYINGTQIGAVSSGTISFTSPVEIVQIGDGESAGDQLGGLIKSTVLWKTRLSNTELATLTTI
jgi:hypothetical protein